MTKVVFKPVQSEHYDVVMTTRWLGVVIVCVCMLVTLSRPCDGHSPSPQAEGITVSLKSRLNVTGHWVSQIGIEDQGQSLSSNRWQVAVKYEKKIGPINQSTRSFVITITEPPPLAGPDYELFPGMGYYKFHPLITNMASAKKTCDDEGAHLLIVNSEEEAAIVKTLYARHPNITNKWAWVGLVEKGLNEYYTIFGDSFKSTGFTRWDPTEPNDSGPNNCIVISKVDGGLHDIVCDGGFPAVCEQELY